MGKSRNDRFYAGELEESRKNKKTKHARNIPGKGMKITRHLDLDDSIIIDQVTQRFVNQQWKT